MADSVLQLTENRKLEVSIRHLYHIYNVKISRVELEQQVIGTKVSEKLIAEDVEKLRSYTRVFKNLSEIVEEDVLYVSKRLERLVKMVFNTCDHLLATIKKEQGTLKKQGSKYDELILAVVALRSLDYFEALNLSQDEKAERIANVPNLTTINYVAIETNTTDELSNKVLELKISRHFMEHIRDDREALATQEGYYAYAEQARDYYIEEINSNAKTLFDKMFIHNTAYKNFVGGVVPKLVDKFVNGYMKKFVPNALEELRDNELTAF